MPGTPNGAWYRTNAVLLHANDLNPRNERRADGLVRPIMYAAWCRVDGDKVCAGRSLDPAVAVRPHGALQRDTMPNPQSSTWPRPDDLINGTATVWGECCVGIRHFDCIGFVNWCISTAHRPMQFSITNAISQTRDVSFGDVWAGDLVTIGTHHIGIATGAGTVVQAKGTKYGVVESALQGFTRCGRLPAFFWR